MGARALLLAALAALTLADRPSSPDWESLARDIVTELNLLRRDPAGYARHLDPMIPRFDGPRLLRPGRTLLETEEGAAAVREAREILERTRPMGELRWSPGMAAAAADHVRDQGPSGGLEHDGSDSSSPARRVSRYGRWYGTIAENMAFGENPARDVVLQLLIDDGVADRGHRAVMLDRAYGAAGAACGPHARYRQMCVIDFAARYEESPGGPGTR